MSKVITVRVADPVAELFEAQAATTGKAAHFTRLVQEFAGEVGPSEVPVNSLGPEAKAQREAVKAEKRARKADLQSSIAAALPARGEALAQRVQAIADKVEEARPHRIHSGLHPIPGCAVCAGESQLMTEAK